MSLISKWRTQAAGVPRVFGTARRAVGSRAALRIVAGSACALLAARARSGGQRGMQNAVRHFAWSAWLASAYGPDVASAVTERHERGSARPLDTEVDRRNNAAGREYAGEHPATGPVPVAVWRLAGIGAARWRQGRLWRVGRGGQVVGG